jgi:uncharacterized phage infection (PIP) family protein YhgE
MSSPNGNRDLPDDSSSLQLLAPPNLIDQLTGELQSLKKQVRQVYNRLPVGQQQELLTPPELQTQLQAIQQAQAEQQQTLEKLATGLQSLGNGLQIWASRTEAIQTQQQQLQQTLQDLRQSVQTWQDQITKIDQTKAQQVTTTLKQQLDLQEQTVKALAQTSQDLHSSKQTWQTNFENLHSDVKSLQRTLPKRGEFPLTLILDEKIVTYRGILTMLGFTAILSGLILWMLIQLWPPGILSRINGRANNLEIQQKRLNDRANTLEILLRRIERR